MVLCGSQDVDLQVLRNFLNHLLGNYGTTVDLAQPSYQRDDNDRELETLLHELHDGKVAALFIYQSNPVHDLPGGDSIAEDLKRVSAARQPGAAAGRNGPSSHTSSARTTITWKAGAMPSRSTEW